MKKIILAAFGILILLLSQSFGSHWEATNLTTTYNLGSTQIDPTGYYWAADNKYHIFYAEGSQYFAKIWELKNGKKLNITKRARAPYAQYGIHAYTTDIDNTQHVVFTRSGSVYEIFGGRTWYPRGWYKNNLTSSSGGAPSAWRYVFGYVSSNDNSQRIIYYCKSNRHIYMIYRIPGGSWNYIDVTAAANAPAVGPAGYEINTKLSAYSWSVDRTDHIVYKGADNHIHELWQQYGTWRHADLTISSGATVTAAANTQPYGLQSEIDQGQHIIYQGSDNHIHELVFKAGSWWTDIDLIAASGNSTIETGYTGGIGACSTPMYDHIWIMYSDYKRNYDIDMLMHNLKPPERMWWNDETANPSSSLSYMPPGNTYTNNPTLFYSGSYDVYNPEHFLYVGSDTELGHINHGFWGKHVNVVSKDEQTDIKATVQDNIPTEYGLNITGKTIHYALPEASSVDIKLFSIKGQLVHAINKGETTPGYYNIDINRQLSKGNYIVQFIAGNFKSQKRMVILR